MEEITEYYPFEEPILWQFSPSKFRTVLFSLKYASIGPAACLLTGIILALTGVTQWLGSLILFGGVAVLTCVIACFALSRQERTVYTVTENQIIVDYPAISCVADFADIKKIRKFRSLFNKNVGTIRFKVKNRLSVNYQFAKIDDVDAVYDLLVSLWDKHKEKSN